MVTPASTCSINPALALALSPMGWRLSPTILWSLQPPCLRMC